MIRFLEKHKIWIYALFLMAAILLLFADLRADAPGDIDHSAGLVFDPPSKCQTARNRVLYGEWRTDDWTPYIHGALHTVIQTVVFYVWGVSMVTMRMPGTVLFALAVLCMALMAARRKDHLTIWVTLTLLLCNPIFLAYGRSGLLEPQLIAWVILSAWALDQARAASANIQRVRTWLFWSGCFAAAAFWTKGMGVYFILAATPVLLITPPCRRRDTLYFFGPILAALALYAGPFMMANQPFFEREAQYWLDRAAHASKWELWSRQPVFHQMGPYRWVLALGLIAIPFTWRIYRQPQDAPIGLRALGLTALIGLQATAFMQYRPLRYAILAVICVVPLAGWLIGLTLRWAREGGTATPSPRATPFVWVLGILCVAYAFNFSVLYPVAAAWRTHVTFPVFWRLIFSILVAVIVVALWWWQGGRIRNQLSRRPERLRWVFVLALWGLVLLPMTLQAARDIRIRILSREHQMYTFSARLGDEYRDMKFAGTSPAFAGMENRHRPRKVTHYGINHEIMEDPELTHLLIPDAWGQPAFFRNTFPEIWARAEVVDRIVISGFPHSLYALDRQPPERIDTPSGPALRNPDTHNPAYVIIWPEDMPEGIARTLLPGEAWQPDVSTLWDWDERTDWLRFPSHKGPSQRLLSVTDRHAWEQRSLRVGSTESPRNLKPGHASWPFDVDTPVQRIGVRARGDGAVVGQILFRWTPKQGEPVYWTLSGEALTLDTFTPLDLSLSEPLPNGKGQLTVEVPGHAPVWLDAIRFW